MKTRALSLEFKDAKAKSHTIKLTNVHTDLSQEEIRGAMDQIAGLNIFESNDGELLYVTPVSAKYVDTEAAVLFDDDAK